MDSHPRPTPRRLLVGVVVLLTVFGLMAPPSPVSAQSTAGEDTTATPDPSFRARPDSRIVGGTQADPGAWPSQVGLLHSDTASNFDAQFCGGTLISRNWVLTAGHCVRDIDHTPTPSDIDVLLGTQDLHSGGTRIRAVEFRIHPSWNPADGRSDLALIRLDHPAPASIQFQAITAQNVSPAAGTAVITTGWGTTVSGGNNYPSKLRQVTVDVSTSASCQNGYPDFYQQSTMVCAAASGKDSCQGDSGGPLVENRSGTWVQVGIVSTGNGCALAGYPGIYTRVAAFSDWIRQQIRYGPQPTANAFVTRMYLDAYDRGATSSEMFYGVANLNGGQLPEVFANNIINQSTYQTRTGGVIRLYQAVFLRRPETAGMAYWWREVNRGVSLKKVADLMVRAPEFAILYGDTTNTEFVDLVYDNVLDRNPAPDELAYWVDELDTGARTRGQVMVGFSESAEYKADQAGAVKVIGAWFALLRTVPGTADITYWSGQTSQLLVTTIIKGWAYANRF